MTGEPATALAASDLSITTYKLITNLVYSCAMNIDRAGEQLGRPLTYKLNSNKAEEPREVIAELD